MLYARFNPNQYVIPFGSNGDHFSIILKGQVDQWTHVSKSDMAQHLAVFKERLLKYIHKNQEKEATKGFEFYFNLDPFFKADGIGTKYADFDDYQELLDPFLKIEDREYYWKKYQLQRAVDVLSRIETDYKES